MNVRKKISLLILTMFLLVLAPSVFATFDKGVYTNLNFSLLQHTSGSGDSEGLTILNNQIYNVEFAAPDFNLNVSVYELDGTYTQRSFDVGNEDFFTPDITNNGSSLFIVDSLSNGLAVIREFNPTTGLYTGFNFSVLSPGSPFFPEGIVWNPDTETFLIGFWKFTADPFGNSENFVAEFDRNGVSTGFNFSIPGIDPYGFAYKDGFLYITHFDDFIIREYVATTGIQTSFNFTTAFSSGKAVGIAYDNNGALWISSQGGGSKAYRHSIVDNYAVCGEVLTSSLTMANSLLRCDLASDGIIINATDVTLDCNGFKIASGVHTDSGIVLTELANSNVNVQNCEIINFANGIRANANTNYTNINVQNIHFNNQTPIGFNMESGPGFFQNGLTLSNSNFSVPDSGAYGIGLIGADNCNLNNLIFSCLDTLSCDTTSYVSEITNCNYDNYRASFFNLGLFLDGGANKKNLDNNVFNNIFFNVTNGVVWGVPFGFWFVVSNSNTIINSVITSDDLPNLIPILQESSEVNETIVIDTTYPFGQEEIEIGTLFRFWTSTITTNIPNVDLSLTPITGNIILDNTGSSQQVVLTLLEYKHNSTAPGQGKIFNSTPYDVVATRTSVNKPTFQQFQLSFTPTNALFPNILLAYTGFTLPQLIFAGIASLAGMAALLLLILGLFMQMVGKKK